MIPPTAPRCVQSLSHIQGRRAILQPHEVRVPHKGDATRNKPLPSKRPSKGWPGSPVALAAESGGKPKLLEVPPARQTGTRESVPTTLLRVTSKSPRPKGPKVSRAARPPQNWPPFRPVSSHPTRPNAAPQRDNDLRRHRCAGPYDLIDAALPIAFSFLQLPPPTSPSKFPPAVVAKPPPFLVRIGDRGW